MLLTLMGSRVEPYDVHSHSGAGTPVQPQCSPVIDGATHQGQAQILACEQMQVHILHVLLCGGGNPYLCRMELHWWWRLGCSCR